MDCRTRVIFSVSLAVCAVLVLGSPSLGLTQCLGPGPGLVGWWPGDGSMVDVVGGNDGSAGFLMLYSVGKVGQAFDLDGTGPITVPYDPILSPQSITIEAWLYPDAVDGFRRIVNQSSYDLFMGPDGLIRCIVQTQAIQGLEIAAGNTLLSASTWSHVACTWDAATGVGRVYLDGAPIGSGVDLGYNNPLVAGTGSLFLGGWSGQNIDGRLDEVSIYDRALTGPEIAAIYGADAAGKCRPDIFADSFESGDTTAWSNSVP